jgi:MFS family permease
VPGPAGILGLIEGTADLLSNVVKLAVGYWGDRIGRRKEAVVTGYALTGAAVGLFALAVSWPLVWLAKSLAWAGKGLRGPLRNAILADAVAPAHRGKAFGFHRAGDTLGAVLGPLLGLFLLRNLPPDTLGGEDGPFRLIFVLAVVPGLAAALTFALMIREQRRSPQPGLRFGASLRALPGPFRRYLLGVGVFGAGDFSHAILILAATQTLAPALGLTDAASAGILLYAWRNLVQASAAFPAGAMGDRFGRVGLLAGGYLLAAGTMVGFAAFLEADGTLLGAWLGLFALAGIYNAIQEALEGATTADLVPDPSARGTAYGVLGAVNGLGDFVSSLAVGLLFIVAPALALGYAAGMMLLGAVLVYRVR